MIVAQSPQRPFKIRKLLRRHHIALAAFTALAGFWLIGAGWLAAPLVWLAEAGVQPVATPLMQGHTALIVLGAGTVRQGGTLMPRPDGFSRIEGGARMYRMCRGQAQRCTLVMSGGDPERHGASEAETYARYLLADGIARDDLQLEPRSFNTYENAKFTARLLQNTHYDAIVLMTSRYHLHRALLDFEHFGVHPQPVAVDTDAIDYGWLPHLHNLRLALISLHEILGTVQFYAYRLIGHD